MAALALSFLAVSINAATFNWVSGSGDVNACACEAQSLTAQIRNDADSAQHYVLEADFGNASENGRISFFVTPSIDVYANSKKTITLIAAPACNAPLEAYPFTLKAFGSSGQLLSLDGTITATECRSLKINAPAQIPTCSGETVDADVRIVNDGDARANGAIITDLAPGVYTLSETSFDLAPDDDKTVTLRITIPSRTPPGPIPFKINAVATGVYAEAFSQITVLDCSGLRVLMPGVIQAEPATSQTQNVALRNDAAGADVFSLSLANCPSWTTLETHSVSLEASAAGVASLTITPPNDAAGKEFNCTLTAKSQKRGNSFEATGVIRVSLPSEGAVSLPANAEYCESDASINVSFSVRNDGDNQGTFELTAQGAPGTLSSSLASIAPGEAKNFVFSLEARTAAQYSLTITAKSAFGTASKTMSVRIAKCNAFDATLEPSNASFCANETKNFTLTIKNNGRSLDSYAVTAQAQGFAASASAYAVSIEPGESKQVTLALTAPAGAAAGARSLSVAVKSNAAQTTRSLNAALEFRDETACAANAIGGPTGAFTSLYTGLAGFLVALIAGLFVAFILAGRKQGAAENEEGENGKENKEEDNASAKAEKKPKQVRETKKLKRGGKTKKK